MIRSLRARILVVGVLVAGIPILVAAISSWRSERGDLIANHRQQAHAFAVAFRWQVTDPRDHHRLRADAVDTMPPWHAGDPPTAWVMQRGSIRSAHGPLASIVPWQVLPHIPRSPAQATFQLNEMADSDGRVFVVAHAGLGDEEERLDPSLLVDEPLVVVVRPTADRDAALRRQALAIVIWSMIALGAGMLVLAVTISVALRPLRHLRAAIAGYQPGRTRDGAPIPSPSAAPRELEPVWEALHDLSSRLDATITRERQLVAEVAHELRTPLAGLRARLEVDQPGPEAQRACLRLVCNLQQLVEKLLLLTRLEAGLIRLQPETVILDDLLDEAGDRLGCPDARPWSVTGDTRMQLSGDYELLATALTNLIGNALTHASEPGRAVLAVDQQDGQALIVITNPIASSIDPQGLRDAIACRGVFPVGVSSRSTRHGLGLILSARIVTLHDGQLQIASRADGDGWRWETRIVLPMGEG